MNKILIVDDEQKIRHILQIMLEQNGYAADQAQDGKEALELIGRYQYSMIITDLKMPGMDGMALLREIKKIDPDYPVIVLTAYGSIGSAVEALKEGAIDYITKPFEEEQILMTIKRSARFSELVDERRVHREELAESFDFNNIVAESQHMLQVLKQAAMVSKSPNTTVLLFGESGTGKELLARAIHFNSPRGAKKFVAINCAAIPETLIESELFGHEKGSFTGADKTKQGRFEVAHEGTVFLDEIGDLSLEVQAKLLRFLQEKEFERVGGTAPIQTDVRVIGATNKDLKQLVEQGRFREDLFYRINVFPLHLPPLRRRRKDIIPLAEHFVRIFARQMGIPEQGLSDEVRKILFQYHWPGNVREVQNAIERAVIMAAGGPIRAEHFMFLRPRDAVSNDSADDVFTLPREGIKLEEVELDLVNQALETTNNNQTEAAKLLGLSRGKFRILLKRLRENNDNNT